MGVFEPRKRMVSLRLSDEEYQHLVELCGTQGAHSTSDMVRIAVCDFLFSHGRLQNRRLRAVDLETKVKQLENELQRLSRMLETDASPARRR